MIAFHVSLVCILCCVSFMKLLIKRLKVIDIYAVEHERMAEAYSMINQRLQNSLSEEANLEKTIRELKVCEMFSKIIGPNCIFHWLF